MTHAGGEHGDGAAAADAERERPILSVGRRSRTISPALRRALEVRDRGCRFPGCGLRFTDAHHVKHWADGGKTSLDNCALLCRHHHRLVHEGGWRLEWWGRGRAVFLDPKGAVHVAPDREEASWRREREKCRKRNGTREPGRQKRNVVEGARPAGSATALLADNLRHGTVPGPLTAAARWKRERDIPDEVWFRALEAGIEAKME